jgi:Flp pilus assembly protein TadD
MEAMGRRLIFAALAAGVLGTLAANPLGASGAEENSTTPPAIATHSAAEQARALFAAGQVREAEKSVRAALPLGAGDALLCLWGEILFRRANFSEAAAAFGSAARLNPENARALWGLGRIEELHFRREQARDLFARAYRLNPRDTDIVLSYLDGVSDARARTVLLRNVVTLSRKTDPERAARALAQIQIEERLGGKTPARLASGYTAYRVPLAGFRPAGANQDGLLVSVRINGGKPLRLVLDTGARGILIYGRAARNLALEPIVESRLEGFGGGEGGESQVALARSLAIGGLAFEDCLVEVSRQSVTAGADGILGAGVFDRFHVRVDARNRMMDLTPLAEPQPRVSAAAGIPTIGLRNLLLVKTAVAGKEGWFLLDTGAAYTTLANELVPPVFQKAGSADLVGVRGVLPGAYRLAPLSLGVGAKALVDLAPIALDLAPLSRREGIEISGVLGYSALSKRPFTIDFRRGAVSFE